MNPQSQEPTMNDVAYIYSHDGDKYGIKFDIEFCTPLTLRDTVKRHLYPEGIPDDHAEIFAGVMEELEEKGACDFEDGWIAVKHGAPALAAFMIEQLRECKGEERFESERAFAEMQKREAAEAKYKTLQQALLVALGPNAPEVAEKAAA